MKECNNAARVYTEVVNVDYTPYVNDKNKTITVPAVEVGVRVNETIVWKKRNTPD